MLWHTWDVYSWVSSKTLRFHIILRMFRRWLNGPDPWLHTTGTKVCPLFYRLSSAQLVSLPKQDLCVDIKSKVRSSQTGPREMRRASKKQPRRIIQGTTSQPRPHKRCATKSRLQRKSTQALPRFHGILVRSCFIADPNMFPSPCLMMWVPSGNPLFFTLTSKWGWDVKCLSVHHHSADNISSGTLDHSESVWKSSDDEVSVRFVPRFQRLLVYLGLEVKRKSVSSLMTDLGQKRFFFL